MYYASCLHPAYQPFIQHNTGVLPPPFQARGERAVPEPSNEASKNQPSVYSKVSSRKYLHFKQRYTVADRCHAISRFQFPFSNFHFQFPTSIFHFPTSIFHFQPPFFIFQLPFSYFQPRKWTPWHLQAGRPTDNAWCARYLQAVRGVRITFTGWVATDRAFLLTAFIG